MDMKSGIDKITDILNKYFSKFELTVDMDVDFGYYYADNLITYSLIDIPSASESFLLDAESRFPLIHAPFFIWGLFHEVGHHETYDELTDEEIAESNAIKKQCYDEDNRMLYYTCPDEYAATEWAGNYIMAHEKEITNLWNEVYEVISNIVEDI